MGIQENNYNSVVFLDRDGTINCNYEEGPVYNIDKYQLLPDAAIAIRTLNDLGIKIIVVTNQGGIEHKERDFDWDRYNAIEKLMVELLKKEAGAYVDEILVCPHAQYDACLCRKPKTGLLERAGLSLSFAPNKSYIVGDSCADIIAGKSYGLRTILVTSGWKKDVAKDLEEQGYVPDLIVKDLCAAVNFIKKTLT